MKIHLLRNADLHLRKTFHIIKTRSSSTFTVTLDNIFNEENKQRCRAKLKDPTLFKPIRHPSYKDNPCQAAVLVPLCVVNGESSVIFTLRSNHIPQHRGEVSFPGGMSDHMDENLTNTALRETEEEIGLSKSCVDIWGCMPPVPSRSTPSLEISLDNAQKSLMFYVSDHNSRGDGARMATPVIGFCGDIDDNKLEPCDREVEKLFTRTISSLCHNVHQTTYRSNYGYTMPVFTGGEHKIWGLTAIFLHQTLTIIAPGLYKFKLRHPKLYTKVKS